MPGVDRQAHRDLGHEPVKVISQRQLVVGVGVSVVVVVVLASVGCTSSTRSAVPNEPDTVGGVLADEQPSEVDVGFFTDMSFHHSQALAMCQRVLGTDTGDPVQAAAAEILQNQAYEVGMMHTWLRVWGASTAPPDEVMAWMGMAMPAGEMPGLASDAEMRELSVLTGTAKGRYFLELMRAHHVGGVRMADATAATASTAVVRGAAERMAELSDNLMSCLTSRPRTRLGISLTSWMPSNIAVNTSPSCVEVRRSPTSSR